MDEDIAEAQCASEGCANVRKNLGLLLMQNKQRAAEMQDFSKVQAECEVLRMKLVSTDAAYRESVQREAEAINAKEIAEASLKQGQYDSEFYKKKSASLQEQADDAEKHKDQANYWRNKYDSVCALTERLEANNIDIKSKYESTVKLLETAGKRMTSLDNQVTTLKAAKIENSSKTKKLDKYLKSVIQVVDALSSTSNLSKQSKSIKDLVTVFRRDDVRLFFNSQPWKNSLSTSDPSISATEAEASEDPEHLDDVITEPAPPIGEQTLSDDEEEEEEVPEDEADDEVDREIRQLENELLQRVKEKTVRRPDFTAKMIELKAKSRAPRLVETKFVKKWPEGIHKPTEKDSFGLLNSTKIHRNQFPTSDFETIAQATAERKKALLGAQGAAGASEPGSSSSIHGKKGKTVRELQTEMMKGESVKEKAARMRAEASAGRSQAPGPAPAPAASELQDPPQDFGLSMSDPGSDSETEEHQKQEKHIPAMVTRRSARLSALPVTPKKASSSSKMPPPPSPSPSTPGRRGRRPRTLSTMSMEPAAAAVTPAPRGRPRSRSAAKVSENTEPLSEAPSAPVKRGRGRPRSRSTMSITEDSEPSTSSTAAKRSKRAESDEEEEQDLKLTNKSPEKPKKPSKTTEETVGDVLKKRLRDTAKTTATVIHTPGPPLRTRKMERMRAPTAVTSSKKEKPKNAGSADSSINEEEHEDETMILEEQTLDLPQQTSQQEPRISCGSELLDEQFDASEEHSGTVPSAPELTKNPAPPVPEASEASAEPPKIDIPEQATPILALALALPTVSPTALEPPKAQENPTAELPTTSEISGRAPQALPTSSQTPPTSGSAAPPVDDLLSEILSGAKTTKTRKAAPPAVQKSISSTTQQAPPTSVQAPPTSCSAAPPVDDLLSEILSGAKTTKTTKTTKMPPVDQKKISSEAPPISDSAPTSVHQQTPKSPKQILNSKYGLDISDSEDEEEEEEERGMEIVEEEEEAPPISDSLQASEPSSTATVKPEKVVAVVKIFSPEIDSTSVEAPPEASVPPKAPAATKIDNQLADQQASEPEPPKARKLPIARKIPPKIKISLPAPSSSTTSDDDLMSDILAGAKTTKTTKPKAPPTRVAQTTRTKNLAQKRKASPPTPAGTTAPKRQYIKKSIDSVLPPSSSSSTEPPSAPDSASTTSSMKKGGGAIMIEAVPCRPGGKAIKREQKPIGMKEMMVQNVEKGGKKVNKIKTHLRQALDLKIPFEELKRPMEEKGIKLGDSIPLTPSDAVDVMMEFLRETSAADMWAVLNRQRIDANLKPLMNKEEENFLQVSVTLNEHDQQLLEVFISRIIFELCARESIGSNECGRLIRLFCHAVRFSESAENPDDVTSPVYQKKSTWIRRLFQILLLNHPNQIGKSTCYILMSDVAKYCRFLVVEEMDKDHMGSEFHLAFRVLMHKDSEQASAVNWLLNAKFDVAYVAPPTSNDVTEACINAHKQCIDDDDVTPSLLKKSIFLAKTAAPEVLNVAFDFLRQKMDLIEEQFLKPKEMEKEPKRITAFSVPTVVTKMTKSEAEMLKKESKWQKNVLRVMIDNPFSSHSHAIFAALKQISPQVSQLREIIESSEINQYVEMTGEDAIRDAVQNLVDLISIYTNFPLKPTTLPPSS